MRVSIITACYNSHAVISTAFDSVLRQHHPNIEYIVIDGGSTDGTVSLIREWEPRFGGRMRWVSERDAGLYDAINKGIRMATGDVIGILNADDFYTGPDVLDQMTRLFRPDVDAAYADVRFVDGRDISRTVRYVSGRGFRPWMMRFGFMPPHPTILCRRELFSRLGFYRTDYAIAADHELMVRFLWKARTRTAYWPRAIIAMRTGGVSTRSWRNRWLACRENVRACRDNGIHANLFMQVLKYPVKALEFVGCRLR